MWRLAAVVLLATLFPGPGARTEEDPPTRPAPPPDYAFYEARVAPLVERLCTECHADPRRRLGRHRLRPAPGRRVRARDHRRNYETILSLLVPGDPAASKWLLKPLGPRQGGLEHGGGERIRIDSLEYGIMVDFINGAVLPSAQATAPTPAGPPLVDPGGLEIAAADAVLLGDAHVEEPTPVEGESPPPPRVAPGAAGGEIAFDVRIPGPRAWQVEILATGPGEGARLRVGDGAPQELRTWGEGAGRLGPTLQVDDASPLEVVVGEVRFTEDGVRVAGRPEAPARIVFPCRAEHDRIDAAIRIDAERDGGDDALLLFDVAESGSGGVVGLVDGGRRVALGHLERGVPRWVASARIDRPDEPAPREVSVSFAEDEVTVRVDGVRRLVAPLEGVWGRGPVGLLAHGGVTLLGLSAHAGYEVWRARPREVPALVLGAGVHRLRVLLPPGGPAIRALRIAPLEPAPR